MRRADDYRQNAEECRKLADKMPPAVREHLMTMAVEWDRAAEERERLIALKGSTEG